VLKIHVVRQGGHHYYVADLIPGRAAGGRVAGEEPGAWSGGGAAALGLRGAVRVEAFGEVFDGRHPTTGAPLRRRRGDRSVSGYDLTFCAPKSVSLLHVLAPKEIATEVGAGHRAAVDEAAGYLGRAAVGVCRGRHGQVALLASTGPVAGAFVHRTSRALDPHLHTHLVVANVAEGVDGRWSAVDSRRLFAHLGAVQGIYHARLRLELGARIGASWEVRQSGLGDVSGVDPTMRRLFSQRTASMDEYGRGAVRPAAPGFRSRAVFHATRPDKDHEVTVEALVTEWKQRAVDFGFDLGDLTRVVGARRDGQHHPDIDHRRVQERLERMVGQGRPIARRHVVATVAAAATLGAPADQIESVASRIVEVAGPPVAGATGSGLDAATGCASRGTGVVEPRWQAADVARAVERFPAVLAAGETPGSVASTTAGRQAVDRGRRIGPRIRTNGRSHDSLRPPTDAHSLDR